MSKFPIHTVATAPAASQPLLERAHKAFGFVPNLAGALAESPAALEAFLALDGIFARTSLSPLERQVVLLATSVANECHYCTAAHSAISALQKLPGDVVASLRDGRTIADAKLEALRRFTTSVVEKRGWVEAREVEALLAAGYTARQMLDVLTGVTVKTLTNYVNHIERTPLDSAFEAHAWRAPSASAR